MLFRRDMLFQRDTLFRRDTLSRRGRPRGIRRPLPGSLVTPFPSPAP